MSERKELVARIKAIAQRHDEAMAAAFEAEAGPLLDELVALKAAEIAARSKPPA